MSFSKSKVKRFNEKTNCVPSPGRYNPKDSYHVCIPSFDKSERFRNLLPEMEGTVCQAFENFSASNRPKSTSNETRTHVEKENRTEKPLLPDTQAEKEHQEVRLEKEMSLLQEQNTQMREHMEILWSLLQDTERKNNVQEQHCESAEGEIVRLENNFIVLRDLLRGSKLNAIDEAQKSREHTECLYHKLQKKEEIIAKQESRIQHLQSIIQDQNSNTEKKAEILQQNVKQLTKLLDNKDVSLRNLELELKFAHQGQHCAEQEIISLSLKLETVEEELQVVSKKGQHTAATYQHWFDELYQCMLEQQNQYQSAMEQMEIWKNYHTEIKSRAQVHPLLIKPIITEEEFRNLQSRYLKLLSHQNTKQKIYNIGCLKDDIMQLRNENGKLKKLLVHYKKNTGRSKYRKPLTVISDRRIEGP